MGKQCLRISFAAVLCWETVATNYLRSGVHHSGTSFGMRSFRSSCPHWGSNSTATFFSARVPNCIAILCPAWVISLYPAGR